MWYVYMVSCSDNSLYTGITTDIERRLRQHNGELASGAKYTLSKRPVILVYSELVDSRSKAMKREATIKRLSHDQKTKLFSF